MCRLLSWSGQPQLFASSRSSRTRWRAESPSCPSSGNNRKSMMTCQHNSRCRTSPSCWLLARSRQFEEFNRDQDFKPNKISSPCFSKFHRITTSSLRSPSRGPRSAASGKLLVAAVRDSQSSQRTDSPEILRGCAPEARHRGASRKLQDPNLGSSEFGTARALSGRIGILRVGSNR